MPVCGVLGQSIVSIPQAVTSHRSQCGTRRWLDRAGTMNRARPYRELFSTVPCKGVAWTCRRLGRSTVSMRRGAPISRGLPAVHPSLNLERPPSGQRASSSSSRAPRRTRLRREPRTPCCAGSEGYLGVPVPPSAAAAVASHPVPLSKAGNSAAIAKIYLVFDLLLCRCHFGFTSRPYHGQPMATWIRTSGLRTIPATPGRQATSDVKP